MSYQQEINDYLNRHVPLFQAMQARLERCDDAGLTMQAPLAPNINDKGIAFGGSMAAIASLTGWALTRVTLREHGETAEIVITDSTLKFLRPVRGEIVTECARPDADHGRTVHRQLPPTRQGSLDGRGRHPCRWRTGDDFQRAVRDFQVRKNRINAVLRHAMSDSAIHSKGPARTPLRRADPGGDGHASRTR
jgi:thioesterase domain-containing protein